MDCIAAAVDFLLIPCRPSAFDLVAVAISVQAAQAAHTPAACVLNACPARAPEMDEVGEVLSSYGLPVVPVDIGHRRAFARAVASGRAVTACEAHGKAAEEIIGLGKWLRQQMGGKQAVRKK